MFWGVSTYSLLLVLSWFVQTVFPTVELPGKFEKQVEISIEGDNHEIKYHEICPADCNDSSAFILIPDAYFGAEAVLPLAEYIGTSKRVVIPNLSSIHESDISERFTISGKSKVLEQFLNQMEIDSSHLGGHGYGGLIAVDMAADSDPTIEIMSLSLIGSLGVQELRFLGNHHINQSLYSISRPLLQLYKYAFPHFGWANHQNFNLNYVDAMRKLDQRNFSELTTQINQPVKILHAKNDPNVPLITARETYRLLPQSEFNEMDQDLSRAPKDVEKWGDELIHFFDRVDTGSAIVRSKASEERIQKAQEPFDSDDVEPLHGKALLIIVLLIMIFTIFSEDLSVIAAGLLAAGGILPFYLAVFSVFVGIIIVDTNIYWLGKAVGVPVLKQAPFRWMVDESDLHRAQNLYEMYGLELLFIARFIPGARFPTYFSAGLLKSSFKKFFLYFSISVAIWAPLLVGLTVLIGQPMIHYLSVYQDYAIWILLFTILLIYLIVKVGIPLTTIRGRRRLLVKWSRFWQRWSLN